MTAGAERISTRIISIQISRSEGILALRLDLCRTSSQLQSSDMQKWIVEC
jgi:hypothetical protein